MRGSRTGTGEKPAKTPAPGRSATGQFLPGISGNKAGRAATDYEHQQKARQYSDEALEILVGLMRCGVPDVMKGAATEILNRAHGRPHQSLSVTTPPQDQQPVVVRSAAEEAFAYLEMANRLDHPGYVVDYERKTAEPVPAVSPELLPTPTPTLPPAFEPRLDNESGPLMSLADPTPEPPPVRVADPDDGSIVEVVLSPEQIADADLRQQHTHTPKADSTCPGCKHLWVIS